MNEMILRQMALSRGHAYDAEPSYSIHDPKPVEVGGSWNDNEVTPQANYSLEAMMPHILNKCQDDGMLNRLIDMLGRDRVHELSKPKPKLLPIPDQVGTVEMSIWDNMPFGSSKKEPGIGCRFGVSLKIAAAGNRSPLNKPEFRANADLMTSKEFKAKLNQRWKLQGEERAYAEDMLGIATDHNMLLGRLFVKGGGSGTHFFEHHYVLVSEAKLMDRTLDMALIFVGARRIVLPAFDTKTSTGDSFPVNERTTAQGKVRKSAVILQSRASDIASLTSKSWPTGSLA